MVHRSLTLPRPPSAAVGMSAAAKARHRGRDSVVARLAAEDAQQDTVLHLMRHGTTEMNVYLARAPHPYGSSGFRDPMLFDTRLTAEGQRRARTAQKLVEQLDPKPQLLVVSPLSRALHTATLAFGERPPCPTLIEPLVRERLYLSSDTGRGPQELAADFAHYSFGHLPSLWWHHDGSDDHQKVVEEPEDAFDARMQQLRSWLDGRPETCIAVVSHWGVLHSLTGTHFDNCELRTVRMSELHV